MELNRRKNMREVLWGRRKTRNLENKEKKSSGFFGKLNSVKSFSKLQQNDSQWSSDVEAVERNSTSPIYDSGPLPFNISKELKPMPSRTGPSKVAPVGSRLGKAGMAGLERAVEVLDTLGSSMSNLHPNSGFMYGISSRGNKISILAFEVANTIVKGANLIQSLSQEDVQFLKNEILHSVGVKLLVSTDTNELISIAALDKREELDLLCKEVIRFGDLCKDPQWHNLGRFLSKFDLDYTNYKQRKEDADMSMQELTTLAEYTSDLYHELHALDRFQQDYNRKLEEMETLNLPRKDESIVLLHAELKQQKKVVRSLKKKSLWSKSLEQIVEKLVDIVSFLHQEILEAFEENGTTSNDKKEPTKNPQRLGQAGLALHYANLINQIDNIASRPTSLPSNVRDSLYNGLPASVKTSLRSRLLNADSKKEFTMSLIKDEMEKILKWLVPVATNTTKAHQGFGWVGEWANTSNEFNKKTTNNSLIRLQTLYHADKQKTDDYILDLVIWLHRMITVAQHKNHLIRSPVKKGLAFHSNLQRLPSFNYSTRKLTHEDRKLMEHVTWRRPVVVPRISKSQDFDVAEKANETRSLSRSAGNSPIRDLCEIPNKSCHVINDDIDYSFLQV